VRSRGTTQEELEQLYRAQFDVFLRVATAITHDGELGRDAVQAAFVAAVRARRSFRGSGRGLDSWVWTIVLREARRLARTEQHVSLEALGEDAATTTNGSGASDSETVRRYISALPQRQREAVFLRYFADLDYRTIARVLDVEPGTVSATLSAAHHTLRKRLEARTR
jgi:RNA polymerase sigma factor (sigma-70 family)